MYPDAKLTSSTTSDRRWYVLVTVGIGTFLSSLNTSITNTILPVIERDLNISMNASEWIVLIYLLVLTVVLLPFGRLADLFGHRRVFLTGFALIIGSAVVCGVSRQYLMLVVGRGLLALSGAMILSVGPALTALAFPPEQRGKVLGMQALMTYIGLSVGPVLGGLITKLWNWESTFFATLPFALIGLVLGLWALPQVPKKRQSSIDTKGFVTFVFAITTAVLLLNSNDIVSHRGLILGIFAAVFILSAWLFISNERRHPNPMLNLHLFQRRNFGFGNLGAAFNYLCFFLTMFLLPFYLDRVLHFSSSTVGLYLSISPVVMTICAPLAGNLSDKTGPRLLTTIGMVCSTLSLMIFAAGPILFAAHLHFMVIAGLFVSGLGTGTFAAPNNSAILGSASRPEQGVASGTLATFRYIGMMAGITLGASLFDSLLAHFSKPTVSTITAFTHAFSSVMYVGAAFGAIGIGCAIMMIRPQRQVG